jgi:Tfp pilus assembly protein PilZ
MSAPASATPTPAKPTIARVALFHLDETTEGILRECFKQFNIDVVHLEGDPANRLFKEKFEACVVPLDHADAAKILDAARTSPSNRRLVIYAIAADSAETLRFSKHGLNVVLPRPLERQAALRAVRASHLLVLHELRRYVRVPVVAEVAVEIDRGGKATAVSCEVSGGGMSLSSATKPTPGENVAVTFTLPNAKKTTVRAVVCWARPGEGTGGEALFGIRFQTDDDRRHSVKEWIEAYLDM